MPPRKRAASAPKPEETLVPDTDADGQPDEETAEGQAPDTDETPTSAGGGQDPEADQNGDGDGDEPPERSDLQAGEPCAECFPGGWAAKADTVGAVGCEHGTWQRDPVN